MADLPIKPGDDKLAMFFAKKKAIVEGKDPEQAAKEAYAKFHGKPLEEAKAEVKTEVKAEANASVEAAPVVEEPPKPPKTPEAKEFFDAANFKVEELGKDFSGALMYEVSVEDIIQVCKDLKAQRKFNLLNYMTAVELKKGYQNILRLESSKHDEAVVLKVTLAKDKPVMPTLTEVFASANWQEREAYDMLGIAFEGHPKLTRILNPDNWDGFPLRKDYMGPLDGLNQPIKYGMK